jgi:predicted esterase
LGQITFDDAQAGQDETGILRSQRYFHSLIASEVESGIPSERIVLGGFSQGGAMSIFSGVTSEKKLGGIFGLSCYLLLHSKLDEFAKNGANKQTPIFLAHGDRDPMVKPDWGIRTAEELKKKGYNVELKMYP